MVCINSSTSFAASSISAGSPVTRRVKDWLKMDTRTGLSRACPSREANWQSCPFGRAASRYVYVPVCARIGGFPVLLKAGYFRPSAHRSIFRAASRSCRNCVRGQRREECAPRGFGAHRRLQFGWWTVLLPYWTAPESLNFDLFYCTFAAAVDDCARSTKARKPASSVAAISASTFGSSPHQPSSGRP